MSITIYNCNLLSFILRATRAWTNFKIFFLCPMSDFYETCCYIALYLWVLLCTEFTPSSHFKDHSTYKTKYIFGCILLKGTIRIMNLSWIKFVGIHTTPIIQYLHKAHQSTNTITKHIKCVPWKAMYFLKVPVSNSSLVID